MTQFALDGMYDAQRDRSSGAAEAIPVVSLSVERIPGPAMAHCVSIRYADGFSTRLDVTPDAYDLMNGRAGEARLHDPAHGPCRALEAGRGYVWRPQQGVVQIHEASLAFSLPRRFSRSVEDEGPRRPSWGKALLFALLLPLTIPLDLATAPIQGLILLALLPEGLVP